MTGAKKTPAGKAKKKPKKAKCEPVLEFEKTIYDGSRALGFIYGDAGVITAQMADETPLGGFKTSNAAMQAILAADRAAREAA